MRHRGSDKLLLAGFIALAAGSVSLKAAIGPPRDGFTDGHAGQLDDYLTSILHSRGFATGFVRRKMQSSIVLGQRANAASRALEDDYFVQRKLYPNIDFYSGITLRALGFPTSMFTALFALARTVGWIAQWKEMLEDPHQKIGRPRQIYTGKKQRDYTPLSKR